MLREVANSLCWAILAEVKLAEDYTLRFSYYKERRVGLVRDGYEFVLWLSRPLFRDAVGNLIVGDENVWFKSRSGQSTVVNIADPSCISRHAAVIQQACEEHLKVYR